MDLQNPGDCIPDRNEVQRYSHLWISVGNMEMTLKKSQDSFKRGFQDSLIFY